MFLCLELEAFVSGVILKKSYRELLKDDGLKMSWIILHVDSTNLGQNFSEKAGSH